MATTDAEMLVLVNAAITDLLGKKYTRKKIGEREFSYQDLGELFKERDRLQKQVDADTAQAARSSSSRINFANFGG